MQTCLNSLKRINKILQEPEEEDIDSGEAAKALNGDMEEDVKEIVLCIASQIMKMAQISQDLEKNKKMILENIKNGKAYKKFEELIQKQYGDIKYLKNIKKAKYIVPVESEKSGIINKLNAEKIGRISLDLGARKNKKRRQYRLHKWNCIRKENRRQSK